MPPLSRRRKDDEDVLLTTILGVYRNQTGNVSFDPADLEDPAFVQELRLAVEADSGIDINRQDFRKLLRKLLSER